MHTNKSGEQRFWENHLIWKENNQSYYISKDLLRVDWKSHKYRGMKHNHSKLTPAMKRALTFLLVAEGKKPNKRTLKALQWRMLVDTNGNLSEQGKILALSRLSLNRQCQILNIPLEEWFCDSIDHPEVKVQTILREQGISAFFVENAFSLFVDCMMGFALINVAAKLEKSVFTLNLSYDPELFFWIKRDLNDYLDKLDNKHIQRSSPICIHFLQRMIMDESPTEIFDLLEEIYQALGIMKVKSLIRMVFSNPLAYNYRGWPDLLVVGEQGAYCIEVKTTDKLHLNQLVTIPDLVSFTDIPVKVVRLSRQRKQYI